jgi:heme/copper-type cytochrome/quinol oxidase subunit 2
METALWIAILFVSAVVVICLVILLAYCCYRKYKQNQYEKEDSEESPVDNVNTPNIIMTRKDRTEDLFTGKRMPFGVHSSMTNIPDEVENENKDGTVDRNTLQRNGFKSQYNSSFLSVHSIKSNAPSFSDHAGEDNGSIQY